MLFHILIILSIEFIERDRSDTEPYQSASGMTSHLHHPVRIGGGREEWSMLLSTVVTVPKL